MDIGKLFRDAWGLFVKDIGPLIVGVFIASIVPSVAAMAIAAATVGASISGLEIDAQGDITGVESLNWSLLSAGSAAVVVVTLLLSVPLYAGILSGVVRRIRHGRPIGYGDAFAGFRLFGRVVWAAVLLALIFLAIFAVPIAVIVAGALMADAHVVVALGVVLLVPAIMLTVYLEVLWVYIFALIVDRGLGVTESMRESRGLVRASGWWWTFLALFLLQLVVGAASAVLGVIPFLGTVASIALYPFALTYVVSMYFQSRREEDLIAEAVGLPRPGGTPPYPAAPSGSVPSSVPQTLYADAPPPPPRQPERPDGPPSPGPSKASDGGSDAAGETPAAESMPSPVGPTAPEAPPAPEPPAPLAGA
jgi:hypothetical protein